MPLLSVKMMQSKKASRSHCAGNIKIFTGSSNPELVKQVASHLDVEGSDATVCCRARAGKGAASRVVPDVLWACPHPFVLGSLSARRVVSWFTRNSTRAARAQREGERLIPNGTRVILPPHSLMSTVCS